MSACPTCGGRLLGESARRGCHYECEPTTCTCDEPTPNGLGECQSCFRLVLSHSWHAGIPSRPSSPASEGVADRGPSVACADPATPAGPHPDPTEAPVGAGRVSERVERVHDRIAEIRQGLAERKDRSGGSALRRAPATPSPRAPEPTNAPTGKQTPFKELASNTVREGADPSRPPASEAPHA